MEGPDHPHRAERRRTCRRWPSSGSTRWTTEFDTAAFAAILANRKKQIKALLQDQTAFAGIGNAYSDEILHAAKISPVTHAASLSTDAVERLADATRAVLAEATAARRGVPPSELRATKHAALRVHRKTGEPAPSAAMRSGSTRSPAPRRSTARPARPAGSLLA